VLTFLIVCEPNERESERKRKRKEKLLHSLYTCKFFSSQTHTHTYIHNHFLVFLPSLASFFLFDTHTVSWLLCVCRRLFFSLDSRAHTHTHTQVSRHLYFYALFSLSSLLVGVVSRFSFSRVSMRGPVRTFFYFFFFFFFFYNANIMSAARPIDSRQLHALRSWKNRMAAVATAAKLEITTTATIFNTI